MVILLSGEGSHWAFGVVGGLALVAAGVSWMMHERREPGSAAGVDPFDDAVYPDWDTSPESKT